MFQDEDRRIFWYEFKGEKVAVDPLKISRALKKAVPGDDAFEGLCESAFKDMDEVADEFKDNVLFNLVFPAQEQLADLARTVFGYEAIRPDGSGMTDAEAIGLLDQYLAWAADLKKDGPNSSDSPSTTDGPAADSAEG